jgi:hypothetical protein
MKRLTNNILGRDFRVDYCESNDSSVTTAYNSSVEDESDAGDDCSYGWHVPVDAVARQTRLYRRWIVWASLKQCCEILGYVYYQVPSGRADGAGPWYQWNLHERFPDYCMACINDAASRSICKRYGDSVPLEKLVHKMNLRAPPTCDTSLLSVPARPYIHLVNLVFWARASHMKLIDADDVTGLPAEFEPTPANMSARRKPVLCKTKRCINPAHFSSEIRALYGTHPPPS